ncbi:hypothetical protein [Pedobacter sp. UC225_65]|uniref:hypothetical protein n=1 Tax=Pedobacter sp. UC225_65 TaxID=3350173 RepID=UPI00367069B6
MKKIILLLSLVVSTIFANAQEAPPRVPPVKNVIDAKLPQLPPQPVKFPIGDPMPLPNRPNPIIVRLTTHTWKLIRWWVTGNIGHSTTDIAFKFLANGKISCSLWTPEAMLSLQSGTYAIDGNNVTISLKKDANVSMDCNLVYTNNNNILTGTYTLQVLPIANAPTGYTPGTVTGELKLEIKP